MPRPCGASCILTSGPPSSKVGRSRGHLWGRDALMAQFDRVKADWAEHRITDVEAIVDEGEWSVVGYRWQVRGAASGLETQFDQVVAVRVKDSQVTELHYRWGREDALEAAGLAE